MMRWREPAGICVGLFLSAALLGCATSDRQTKPTLASNDRGRSGLPVEAILLLSDDRQAKVDVALRASVDQCMRERGFDYHSPTPPVVSESVFSMRIRYGSLENAAVDRLGYRDLRSVELADFSNHQQDLAPAEMTALVGGQPITEVSTGPSIPATDCTSLARASVYRSQVGMAGWPGYQALVDLQIRSSDMLYAGQAGARAMQAWSRCMTVAGYAFTNWWDPLEALHVNEASLEGISTEEIRTAVTDKRCRIETRLEARLLEAESAIQTQLLADSEGIVADFLASSSGMP